MGLRTWVQSWATELSRFSQLLVIARSWLSGIGLGGHADLSAKHGVEWDVLHELTEADLKELGLSVGDRKRLSLPNTTSGSIGDVSRREPEYRR